MKNPGEIQVPVNGGFKTDITQDKLELKFRLWQEAIDEMI